MSDSQDFPFDVFLSHASEDKEAVKALARSLGTVGIKAWIDAEQMPPGAIIDAEVAEGLDQSRHLLTWITDAWVKKVYPRWEVGIFSTSDQCGRKLIPILRTSWDIKRLGPEVSRRVALGPDV